MFLSLAVGDVITETLVQCRSAFDGSAFSCVFFMTSAVCISKMIFYLSPGNHLDFHLGCKVDNWNVYHQKIKIVAMVLGFSGLM